MFRDFLSDTLLVLGAATVLLSIVQPFLVLSDITPLHDHWGQPRVVSFLQADFFTFKVTYDPNVYPRSEFWNAYWFNNGDWRYIGSFPSVAYVLIATFVVQILTLILGLAALPMKTRLRVVPLVSCLIMTFLITWIYFSLRTSGSPRGLIYSWSLGDGYWLALASILCLSTSTILARGRQSMIMFEK